MANRIMTGKQILKAVTEEKLGSLGEFWDRRDELISSDRITSAQMEKWSHFKESPAYLRIEEYVEYVSKRRICSMNRLDDEYPEYMSHLTNMPLVLFYKGDISLLSQRFRKIYITGDSNVPFEELKKHAEEDYEKTLRSFCEDVKGGKV